MQKELQLLNAWKSEFLIFFYTAPPPPPPVNLQTDSLNSLKVADQPQKSQDFQSSWWQCVIKTLSKLFFIQHIYLFA